MTTTLHCAPPFDAELKVVLDVVGQTLSPTLTLADLPALRADPGTPPLPDLLAGRPITHQEHTVPGPGGAPDLLVSVFRRADQIKGGPAFFFTHVGWMIFGDRFTGISTILGWVEELDAVMVTVEYRLAPENPAPPRCRTATPRCCGPPPTPGSWVSTRRGCSPSGPAPAAVWPPGSP